jgi:hypothetical protein
LNNPNDITVDAKYAAICGYTQQELENCFAEHIIAVSEQMGETKDCLLAKIREWYDGYTWDGKTSLYNPFSTLLFFDKKEFANYWFRTGTPTFLMNILKAGNRIEAALEPVTVGQEAFESFDPEKIAERPLLFQSGYLTVKHKQLVNGQPLYTLGVPNSEVKESLLKHLLNVYTDYPVEDAEILRKTMQQHICECDEKGLDDDLRRMLAYVPYKLHIAKEAYYHSIFLIWMKMLGFDIQGEIMTNIGRIDAVWQHPDFSVVAELKFHTGKTVGALLEEAITQIRNRRYYEKYLDRKVILMGVAFSGKEIACKLEPIK